VAGCPECARNAKSSPGQALGNTAAGFAAGWRRWLRDVVQVPRARFPTYLTREQLAKLNRQGKKKGSNDEWQHPHDPDARITKMKDGRTHLAHKAEHAVDMETGAIVAVTLRAADEGDTTTIVETVAEAGERVNPEGQSEIVTDKGITAKKVVSDLLDAGVRNTPNFSNPSSLNFLDRTSFGRITSTRDNSNAPRELQFGFKFYW
jgi:hypothetical protein